MDEIIIENNFENVYGSLDIIASFGARIEFWLTYNALFLRISDWFLLMYVVIIALVCAC